MTIDYSLTLKEYCRYQGLLMRRSPWIAYSLIVTLVVPLFLLWTTEFRLYTMHMPVDITRDLVFDAVVTVVYLATLSLILTIPWLLNRQYFLEIDKEGITFKLGGAKGHSLWPAINRIDQDADNIYIGSQGQSLGKLLMASNTDPVMKRLPFAMVPKRAFGFPTEAQAFFDQVTGYWKEAVGRPVEASNSWPPAPVSADRECSRED